VAETGGKYSTEEIWFNDAVMLLAERSGESADYAQELLVKGLEDGCVSWSHMKDGIRVKGDTAFWRHRQVELFLEIDRAKNLAMYAPPIAGPPSDVPSIVRDIKVTRWAALALLPQTVPVPPPALLPPETASPKTVSETAPPATTSTELETTLKVSREDWLDQYLTEERQDYLSKRHNQKSSAAREIHDAMRNDPTVEPYVRARNIERHPIVRKLFPPSRRRKKKG
jgi:hypothetical protein